VVWEMRAGEDVECLLVLSLRKDERFLSKMNSSFKALSVARRSSKSNDLIIIGLSQPLCDPTAPGIEVQHSVPRDQAVTSFKSGVYLLFVAAPATPIKLITIIRSVVEMDHSSIYPYLTAAFHASDAELDLSGLQTFRLELVVTLHASKPVILYVAETFLSPSVALLQGGIVFVRQGEDPRPKPRSTIDTNRGNGTDRPWVPRDSLPLKLI
jgi:hypothetical protein